MGEVLRYAICKLTLKLILTLEFMFHCQLMKQLQIYVQEKCGYLLERRDTVYCASTRSLTARNIIQLKLF